MKVLLTTLAIVLSASLASAEAMDQERLQSLLKDRFEDAEISGNVVSLKLAGRQIYCVSDATADRMRIITPIIRWADVSAEQKDFMLIANFHRALDARYAASDGVVYSAFIHPLSSLSEAQLDSALRQVNNLAVSFGSTYTSGEMHFSEPPVADDKPAVNPT